MTAEQQRGPRWLTQAGSAVRRTALPGLKAAVRREAGAAPHLRPSEQPPSGLGTTAARPGARLPEGFAVLFVVRSHSADGRDGYRLQGRCGTLTVTCEAGPGRLPAPAVSLANLKQGDGGAYPSEVLRGIRLWSGNQRQLADWINQARARHGAGLRLIVWDDTGYELPWELFWLPDDPRLGMPGGLLGALVVMSRWTTVHDVDHDLPRETGQSHGRVLGYLHRDMADDGSVFAPYAHRMHGTLTPFLKALDDPADRTGLVYMGCHGWYGPTVSGLRLGERTWAEYNGEKMHVLRRDSALVCLNACHSGRFVDNRAQGEEALRGFAELFLRKGAGGCIVTAGKVGDLEARALVRRLVREVAARPQQPVTEKLRAFRARAVEEFGPLAAIPSIYNDDGEVDSVGQKRVLRLLYAFMFHYYGHPLTTLRLVACDGGGGTGRG
ncbi:CHAT domain-containing protein [Streptomyces sp. NPDC047085]|uniref:CHAT domain-containing protein n=1 Tax=Streptomyces sp. NPDC047085 TaxID=3155140 RepID=UPI00340A849D